jgi:5'-3' exonuclease
MGIEKFFSSIESNKIANLYETFTATHSYQLNATYFYIDFNSIIHVISKKVTSDLNYVLYRIITNRINKKTEDICKHYNITITDKTAEQYSTDLSETEVSKIIIAEVITALFILLEKYLLSDKLHYLYIAIDGVPLKPKMEEQKKRRYTGTVISNIRKTIYNKHKDELKKDKNRYMLETLRISWNKNLITPGTHFLDQMYNALNTLNFNNRLHKVCPNIKQYVLSGQYEPGEGEKKIVDHMMALKNKTSKFVIYSPDSDVTLLALLLNVNSLKTMILLRHNQQKDNYDVINIDTLSDNLFIYCKNRIKKNVIQKNIIDDIVLILTMFGDDFLPKIESLDVKNDFNRLIDIYCDILKKNTVYLINKTKINYNVLLKLLEILKDGEGTSLQQTYMASHYSNYNRLKKILKTDSINFTDDMNKFLKKLREFNDDIRNNKTKSSYDKEFLDIMKQITKLKYKTSNDFVENYMEHYKRENRIPFVNITFQQYSKSIDDNYHRSKLETSLDNIDNGLKIHKYDEEIYKFEHMLDEYKDKLNSKPLDLGKVYIDRKSYTWKADKIVDSVNRYYKESFNINKLHGKEMDKLCKSYLDGLSWVFNYYYNSYDIEENRNYGSFWSYPYKRCPLLTQLYGYLKNNKDVLSKYKDIGRVKRENYFNCIEQLMYVSPAPSIKYIMPPEYIPFIDKSNFYPNLDNISKNIKQHIDCVGVIFLNKCHLKLNNKTNMSDQQFITTLRKIKLGKETERIRGSSSVYPKIITNNFNDIISLKDLRTNTNKRAYRVLKKKYYASGNPKYKLLYKKYKHGI